MSSTLPGSSSVTPAAPRRRRLSRRVLGLSLLGVLAALALLLWWKQRDPVVEIRLTHVTRPGDVRAFLDLADQLHRAREWKPSFASVASVRVMADLLRLPEHARIEQLEDLLASEEAASNRSLAGMVEVLSPRLQGEQLRAALAMPADELTRHLQGHLDAFLNERRAQAVEALLSSRDTRALLEDYGAAARPGPPDALRRLACRLLSREARDQDRWLEAFLEAVRRDVAPTAQWYARVEKVGELPLGPAGSSLVLRPLRPATGSRGPIAHAGRDTRMSFEVWAPSPSGEGRPALPSGTMQLLDTGLRLFDVLLEEDADRAIRPHTPLSRVDVIPEHLARLLHALGLPEAFGLDGLQVSPSGDAHTLSFRLDFRLVHRDENACVLPGSIQIHAADLPRLEAEARQLGLQARRALESHFLALSSYHGFPARFEPAGPDAEGCRAVLKLPPCDVDLQVAFSLAGSCSWTEVPPVRQRLALARYLCGQSAELKEAAGLAIVDHVRFETGHDLLGGTLTVQADAAGLGRRISDIPWSISPAGTVSVRLGEGQRLALHDLALQQRARPQAGRGVDADAARQAVLADLDRRFPQLSGQVDVISSAGPAGPLVQLGLRVGDWPELTLGPSMVASADAAPQVLDHLLTTSSVQEASRSQWSEVRHSRLGKVTSLLTRWLPGQGTAGVRSDLHLGSIRLPFEQVLRLENGQWLLPDEQELCRLLEPHLEELERAVQRVAWEEFGVDLVLQVDRAGFHPRPWLHLRPPAICLRGRLNVPHWGIGMEVRRARVDGDGLHVEDDLTFRGLLTLPFPHFSLSDPFVRVHLSRKELAIGGSITPPLPIPPSSSFKKIRLAGGSFPGEECSHMGAALGVSEAGGVPVRWDNPWLHVLRLQAQIAGQLNESLVRAEGDLRLFDAVDVARGSLECSFADRFLRGEMRARDPFGGATVEGGLFLNPHRLSLGGKLRLLDLALAVDFRAGWERSPVMLELQTRALLPVIGHVSLLGESDLMLNDPWLKGSGVLPLGLANVLWKVLISRSTFRLEFEWETPDGRKETFVVEEPLTALVDEARLRGQLEERVRTSLEAGGTRRPASAPEKEALGRLPAAPEPVPAAGTLAPPTPMTPAAAPPAPGPASDTSVPLKGDLQVSQDGDHVRIVCPSPGVTYRLPGREAQLEPLSGCWFVLWPGSGHLLVFRWDRQEIWEVRTRDHTTVVGAENLTGRYAGLAPLFPQPGWTKDAPELRRLASLWHAISVEESLRIGGHTPELPRPSPGGHGHLVPYVANGKRHACFSWLRGDRPCVLVLSEEVIPPAEWTAPFFERLARQQPSGQSWPTLLAVGAGEDELALVRGAGGSRLELVAHPGEGGLLLEEVEPVEMSALLPDLQRCVRAAWRQRLRLDNKVLLHGKEGMCLVEEGGRGGIWLLSRLGPVGADPADLPFVSREQVSAWAAESVRHLPARLQGRKQREAAPLHDFARAAVLSWQQLRREEAWGAHPMGLLLGLASRPAP